MQLIFLDITKILCVQVDKIVKLRFYQEEFQKMSRLSVHIIIHVYVFNTFYSLPLCVQVDKIQMKCSCFPLADADFGSIDIQKQCFKKCIIRNLANTCVNKECLHIVEILLRKNTQLSHISWEGLFYYTISQPRTKTFFTTRNPSYYFSF